MTGGIRKCLKCGAAKEGGVCLYSFPKDIVLRKQWAKFCVIDLCSVKLHHRLCSQHFTSSSFKAKSSLVWPKKKVLLNKGAVPSIVNGTSTQLSGDENKYETSNTENRTEQQVSRPGHFKNCCLFCGVVHSSTHIFRFPKDPHRRTAWLEACGLTHEDVNNARICQVHFEPEDVTLDINSKRHVLRKEAVPSLLLPPVSTCITVTPDIAQLTNDDEVATVPPVESQTEQLVEDSSSPKLPHTPDYNSGDACNEATEQPILQVGYCDTVVPPNESRRKLMDEGSTLSSLSSNGDTCMDVSGDSVSQTSRVADSVVLVTPNSLPNHHKGKPSSDPQNPDFRPSVRMGYRLTSPSSSVMGRRERYRNRVTLGYSARRSCSFHNCKNVNVIINSSSELRFYPFPTDPVLRQTWVRVALRTPPSLEELMAAGTNPLICSDHFFPEDFVLGSTGLLELNPTAVPIIFKVTYHEEEPAPKRKKMLDPFYEFNCKHCTVAISEEERRLADEARIIEEELETLSDDDIEVKEELDVDWIENDVPPDNIDNESTDTAPSEPVRNDTSLTATSSAISSLPVRLKPSEMSKDQPTETVVFLGSQPRRLVIKEVEKPSTGPILTPVPTGPDHDCYTLPTSEASSKSSQGTVTMAPKTLPICLQAAPPKPQPVHTVAAPQESLVLQTPAVPPPLGAQPTYLPTQSRSAWPTPLILRRGQHPPRLQPTHLPAQSGSVPPTPLVLQTVLHPPGVQPTPLPAQSGAAPPNPLVVRSVLHPHGVQPTPLPAQSGAGRPNPLVVRSALHPPGVRPTSLPAQYGDVPPYSLVVQTVLHPPGVQPTALPAHSAALPNPLLVRTVLHPPAVQHKPLPAQSSAAPPTPLIGRTVLHPPGIQHTPLPAQSGAAPLNPLLVHTVQHSPAVQPKPLPAQSGATPPTPLIGRTVLHHPGIQHTSLPAQSGDMPPTPLVDSLAAPPMPEVVGTAPCPPIVPLIPLRVKPPSKTITIPKDPTKDETFLQCLRRVTFDQLMALHYGVQKKVESYAEQVKSLLSQIRLLEDRLSKTTERLSWSLCYSRKADDLHPKNENLLVIETVPKCECVKKDEGTDPSDEAPDEDLDDVLADAAGEDVPSVGESQNIVLENERLIKKIDGINKYMKGRRILRAVVIQSEDLT